MDVCSGLRHIVPAGVAVAATEMGQAQRSLTASESRAISAMAPRRLLEFTAGRTCAHEALALLGVPSSGVPIGPQREPLWPSGVVGSISHSRDLAVAAVAPMTVLHAIGIDIEPALPLDSDLLSSICSPAELARLRSGPDTALRAKFVFSAKESVYKCLWPLTRQFLEFSDVEIVLGDSNENFTVVGRGPLREPSFPSLSGRITVAADHIITVACMAATRSGTAAFTF
jgi:4'-phosphopantetheinyl transferase EntD